MAASEYTIFHLKNTIYSCTVRSNVFSIVYTYSFTFLLIYFTCKLAKRQTLCLSYNLYWLFLFVSSYDVFIRNYWGTSRLKVTFKNYKKILYYRFHNINFCVFNALHTDKYTCCSCTEGNFLMVFIFYLYAF